MDQFEQALADAVAAEHSAMEVLAKATADRKAAEAALAAAKEKAE